MEKIFKAGLVFGLSVMLMSCSDWDEFREYTKDGELIYPGKITSLEILSGENRVRVIGEPGPDERVIKMRIFWNDFADSLEMEVTDELKASGFDQIIEVEEGLRTFVVYTYDELGNRSLPVSEIGVSYGDAYRAKMHNRVVLSTFKTDTSTFIIWKPIDLSTGAQHVLVNYDVNGELLTEQTAANSDSTELIGLTVSDTVTYQMVYLPSKNCIDQFYTDLEEYIIN